MKKLGLLLILSTVITLVLPPKLASASDYKPRTWEQKVQEEEDEARYYESLGYCDEDFESDDEFNEESLDDVPAVSQFEEDIYYFKNASGNHWYDKACVATSVSIMILRKACLDGYAYDGDVFSKEAVIDVLTSISDQGTMFRQSDCNLYWHGSCVVDVFNKDGEEYYASIESQPVSQCNLITLLELHPEGILVYGVKGDHHHGVLVSKYVGADLYEVYDSASGTIETREYAYLNGYKNSNRSYKFASLVSEY